jgi:hypothetical protein
MINDIHFFQEVTEIQGYSVAVPAFSNAWRYNDYFRHGLLYKELKTLQNLKLRIISVLLYTVCTYRAYK